MVLPDILSKDRSDCKEINRTRGAARLAEAEPSYRILPEQLSPLRLLILMPQYNTPKLRQNRTAVINPMSSPAVSPVSCCHRSL